MERDLLLKAEEYLSYEEHPVFQKEMEDLIKKNDEKEMNDRFYTQLSFGTGGLRGVIGAGYNRMNPYMVRRATQGLANYIKKKAEIFPASAVIAYDSRRYSREFAEEAALVLGRNEIKAYLFSDLRSTPELSFAVRMLNAAAGIVVTASHNPPQYNGYKVYWSDGAQVVPPHDNGIISEVHKVSGHVESLDKKNAIEIGMLEMVDEKIDDAFVRMVQSYILRPDLFQKHGSTLKVVYTPLHGTGAMPVERILGGMGIQIITVPEQREPDGEFPTVEFPNPEEASAMKMAIELAEKEGADLAMGTDPDADRLGVAVRNGTEFVLLTGNQLGSLLADYIFSTRSELGIMPANPALIKTVVTTELQRRIGEDYGARVYDVLTGFKYIGEKIRQFEQTGEHYVFGGEESYGYLIETEVRDKDAVSAVAATVELALYNHDLGRSIIDHLESLYEKYGYFQESLISRNFKGEAGKKIIEKLMNTLRTQPPISFAGQKVTEIRDYFDGSVTADGKKKEHVIDLPGSNVVQFVLESGIVTARPSGTEPKIKFYASCWTAPGTALNEARAEVGRKIELIEDGIKALIAGTA
jgi:phosphoglucomutase